MADVVLPVRDKSSHCSEDDGHADEDEDELPGVSGQWMDDVWLFET